MTTPHPTKDRLKLADAIAAGKVRHYPFHPPETFNDITGAVVTSKVKLLLSAGLVEVPEPDVHNYSIVRLTPEGMAWRARATGYCERCYVITPASRCCSSHDKQMCHGCYRRTHFVEVCVEGCTGCAREGLPIEMHYWEPGPGSTSPEPGPPAEDPWAPGWPDEHMLEAAMGLLANAVAFDPATRWDEAKRRWFEAYHRHLAAESTKDGS